MTQATGFDPKFGQGARRLPMMAVPWAVVLEMAAANGEGAIKYDPHNWRETEVLYSTYLAACFRHLIAVALGEDVDPDTKAQDGTGGVSHLAKLMASAAVLRDAQIHGTAVDDRPPATPPEVTAALTAVYQSMIPRAQDARAVRLAEKESPT